MRARQITAPVIEPVSLDEAKNQLRVDGTDENPHIAALIWSVRVEAEMVSRRAFLAQTWDLTLDAWPRASVIELPYPPLQSVTSITYIDSDNGTHTMSTDDYFVDIDGEPGRVCLAYGAAWPSGTLRPQAAIKIRFVAGWSTPSQVPANYRLAILLGLSAYYENRGDAEMKLPGAAIDLLTIDRGGW